MKNLSKSKKTPQRKVGRARNTQKAQTSVWYNATHKVNCDLSTKWCKPEPHGRLLTIAKTGNPATEVAYCSVMKWTHKGHKPREYISRHAWKSLLLKDALNANHWRQQNAIKTLTNSYRFQPTNTNKCLLLLIVNSVKIYLKIITFSFAFSSSWNVTVSRSLCHVPFYTKPSSTYK